MAEYKESVHNEFHRNGKEAIEDFEHRQIRSKCECFKYLWYSSINL